MDNSKSNKSSLSTLLKNVPERDLRIIEPVTGDLITEVTKELKNELRTAHYLSLVVVKHKKVNYSNR